MAKRAKTPSFVVSIKLDTNSFVEHKLETKFKVCERIYNTSVRHYRKVVKQLYIDNRFVLAWEEITKINNDKNLSDKQKEKLVKEQFNIIWNLIKEYGLTQYDIEKFMNYQRIFSFNETIGSSIVQKQAKSLSKSIEKAIFKKTNIHFRKYGSTTSFEGKNNKACCTYNVLNNTVTVDGMVIKCKKIKVKDIYLQEALTHRVKYCRIIRKPFRNGFHYYVQLVLEGVPPSKNRTLGEGACGLDQGISTVAYYNEKEANFEVLASNINKYDKEIEFWSRALQRRAMLNNPDCYDSSGKIIKGKKIKRTKGWHKALYRLKEAYRKKTAYIKQSHNMLANQIVQSCRVIIKEPMNFKGFAKKAKALKKQEKPTTLTNKKGQKKIIYKFKKKKRFGKSIQRRSPGLFNKILEDKIKRLGGSVINVNHINYKASQFNHITKQPEKPKLSDRTKIIDNNLVQRDLYSAFLLCNMYDENTIDFNSCNNKFKDFLEKQEVTVNKIKVLGDTTKNFGLKDFINFNN